MTSNQRSRESAYADLVAGLVDARVDVASERFDAELEAAEAAGRIDPASARLLRWWQRESVRAVAEHALATIPATLTVLERAAAEARESVDRADAAWTTARGVTGRVEYAAPAGPAVPPPTAEPAPPAAEEPAAYAPYPPVDPYAVAPAPYAPYPPVDPYAIAPAPAAPWTTPPTPPASTDPYGVTLEPPGYPGAASAPAPVPPAPAAAPVETAYAPSPEEAPAIVDLTAASQPEENEGATPPDGRRRTLLAGLTVLPRSD